MGVVLEKLLLITAVYGVIVIVSPKGENGNIVKFACAIGMMVFLINTAADMSFIDISGLMHTDEIKQGAAKGKEMMKAEINKEIVRYIEKDISDICERYGVKSDVEIEITIEDGNAQIEKIELKGDFASRQGTGFVMNEIKNKYGVHEVIIIED